MNFVPPHWRVGFLFLVLYPLLPSPPPACPPNPHSHTSPSHIHHTHTHSLAHTSSISSLAHTSSISSSIPSNTSLITHSLTHTSLTHSLTHHLLTYTHPTNNHSLTHHHSHTHTSLTLYVAGAGLGALQRGRVHALASLWRPSGVPLASLWRPSRVPLSRWLQTRDLVHCKGVGCTPWRPSGVPLASLVSAALPVAFAWQARDLVHCKGVGCTPWRPSGVPLASLGLRRSAGGFCAAGVGLGALQRGRMYALASLWRPSGVPLASLGLRRSAGGFWWSQRHHNITYQNITWRIITSRHMQQDQYIYVCIHLHDCHPTSHHTKIISPHTLAQKYLIELLMWSASVVHKQSPKIWQAKVGWKGEKTSVDEFFLCPCTKQLFHLTKSAVVQIAKTVRWMKPVDTEVLKKVQMQHNP